MVIPRVSDAFYSIALYVAKRVGTEPEAWHATWNQTVQKYEHEHDILINDMGGQGSLFNLTLCESVRAWFLRQKKPTPKKLAVAFDRLLQLVVSW